MAVPVIPLALAGFGGYAVWRAFREDRSHRSSADNGWRNQAFAEKEEKLKGRKKK
ncbi:hypothetical protein [Altererythrobacter litoralis]|uniref:Uncharacterized protein n=1 Tax=Altererythrobacter litoralis TaxID=3113904 RepID=A0ABU7GBI7_9SPHN|nr:hypothetical protein [Erythrobacteraceae bacterium 1XM1-14]HSM53103.1 hypothetical protein [Erythrobacter sp.]